MSSSKDQQIADTLREFLRLYEQLRALAGETPAYIPDTCPLARLEAPGHWTLSRILFGPTQWGWTCGFCGEEHEE